MRVLISGANGFIGKNLANYLIQKGDQVIAVSRNPVHSNELSWDQLFSNQKNTGAEAFIHLAGKAHDLKNTSEPDEYFRVNADLTERFFDLFLQSQARIFIYMSSVKAVADTVNDELYEDIVPEPKTPYGQSKQKAEQYILSKEAGTGKRVFILRPCMVHGPGNKGNLNLLYKFVLKGIPYPLAAFENKRSFLSISNLEYIIGQLISRDIPGGIYNMADDESLSTNKVIRIIGKAIGKRSKLWKVSPVLIRTMARIGDIVHLPLNSERLKKLTESYVVSNRKIKKALGVIHLPVSSADGLYATIRSFNSQ
ncbi:MAG TPA: NAD-dependent epimerase/dehydratase family protein [Mucilaginibacter sp.]|nr:NAD-dependent epimerase/dehydratase family protein [Mucilaginibacter sp.]